MPLGETFTDPWVSSDLVTKPHGCGFLNRKGSDESISGCTDGAKQRHHKW